MRPAKGVALAGAALALAVPDGQVLIGLAARVELTTVHAFCTQVPTAAMRAIATTVISPIRIVYSTIVAPESSDAKRLRKAVIFVMFYLPLLVTTSHAAARHSV